MITRNLSGAQWSNMQKGATSMTPTLRRKKKVSEKLAINWLAQISLAYAHLCTVGLSEIDLTSQNIAIVENSRGVAKLEGFGFVKADFDSEENNQPISRTRYFAPEQFSQEILEKKFVWSLGIVLYELLTGGEHPFEDQFKDNTYLSRLPNLDFRPNPLISPLTIGLLKLLLQKKPSERISINELLSQQLVKQKVLVMIEHFLFNENDFNVIISQTAELFQDNQGQQDGIDEQAQPQAISPRYEFEEAKINELIQKMEQNGHQKLADLIQKDQHLIERLREREDSNCIIEWKPFEGVANRHGWADLQSGIYYGQCVDGMRDGYGLLYSIDKDNDSHFYECEWHKGLPKKGRRIEILKNMREKYEGQFDGKYLETGFCIQEDEDGETFHGIWKRGDRRQGKQSWTDGFSYEGQYKDGSWHGYGKWTYANGTYEIGEWNKGKEVGVHMYYSKDGAFHSHKNYDDQQE
ncbi:hypothetical protein FGO68_gene4921 [Halteria grandinella]|uniref:Protein kinase domain-containing protein n=1 Tax=Halteria grandinella TaxID=5974 RepID=A0A8J8NU35_HALGN|nr:hypothetical protein FGO68_gene4921 [Halteria grandinella]